MRPSKARQIHCQFQHKRFCAHGNDEAQDIIIGHDLMEALRLVDAEGASQDAAAQSMDVSTATLCRILGQARQHVATALCNGHNIIIEGGNVKYAQAQGRNGMGHMNGNGCGNGRGQGNGRGNGQGMGNGMGRGRGMGNGRGMGQGNGMGACVNADGAEQGQNPAYGMGNGQGNGRGRGMGNGQGRGQGMGNGRGMGRGQGRGMGNGMGACQAEPTEPVVTPVEKPADAE